MSACVKYFLASGGGLVCINTIMISTFNIGIALIYWDSFLKAPVGFDGKLSAGLLGDHTFG